MCHQKATVSPPESKGLGSYIRERTKNCVHSSFTQVTSNPPPPWPSSTQNNLPDFLPSSPQRTASQREVAIPTTPYPLLGRPGSLDAPRGIWTPLTNQEDWRDRPISGTQQIALGHPPPVDPNEQKLPRSFRTALSQLLLKAPVLLSIRRLGWRPSCPDCHAADHTSGPPLQLPHTSNRPDSWVGLWQGRFPPPEGETLVETIKYLQGETRVNLKNFMIWWGKPLNTL